MEQFRTVGSSGSKGMSAPWGGVDGEGGQWEVPVSSVGSQPGSL